jgi:DNA invertase Pin-like site-specific DNA recombinase
MLKRFFDPKLAYRVVLYLRMSSDQQNKRSPEQQQREIETRLRALGYEWVIVKIYRDDAKSGRYLRKRPGYQKMIRDIKAGTLAADLILVDTLERFGRVDELPVIRKELFERHGVLVLTADSNFADPNTPQGKALGMVESMRATEHGRILGHNVLRGKRDAVLQKRWPGGAPPFGCMLRSVMKTVNGREEVDYCVLVPNPTTSWIIALLFRTAAESGWGMTRLARFLNEHPDIPDDLKPFQPSTVGYWLDHEIYYGELVWEKNSTGIVDDTRVVEPNVAEDVLRVPDFCEPLISRELWLEVQRLRDVRRRRSTNRRRQRTANPEKQIVAPAPGMTVRYLLSGLVYCAECGLRMTASSSGEYVTKDGEAKRYTSYVCPGYLGRHCSNGTRVSEEWLRTVVVGKIRERLFPDTNC